MHCNLRTVVTSGELLPIWSQVSRKAFSQPWNKDSDGHSRLQHVVDCIEHVWNLAKKMRYLSTQDPRCWIDLSLPIASVGSSLEGRLLQMSSPVLHQCIITSSRLDTLVRSFFFLSSCTNSP